MCVSCLINYASFVPKLNISWLISMCFVRYSVCETSIYLFNFNVPTNIEKDRCKNTYPLSLSGIAKVFSIIADAAAHLC